MRDDLTGFVYESPRTATFELAKWFSDSVITDAMTPQQVMRAAGYPEWDIPEGHELEVAMFGSKAQWHRVTKVDFDEDGGPRYTFVPIDKPS